MNEMNKKGQRSQMDQTDRLFSDVRTTKVLACQAMLKSGPLFCCPTYQPKPARWGMGAFDRDVWNG